MQQKKTNSKEMFQSVTL